MKTIKKVAALAAVLLIVAGVAAAFANIFVFTGSVDSHDFGTVQGTFIGAVPGTIQVVKFNMKPGDDTGWHYHKAITYAILTKGHLIQKQASGCTTTVDQAGDAFVEDTNEVHDVVNPGPGVATIVFATVFPQSDGPQGGAYPAPNPCGN